MFTNAKTLIVFMLLSEHAWGRPTWSVWATWRPRAQCWWPMDYTV